MAALTAKEYSATGSGQSPFLLSPRPHRLDGTGEFPCDTQLLCSYEHINLLPMKAIIRLLRTLRSRFTRKAKPEMVQQELPLRYE
jgi:hypothetical protein